MSLEINYSTAITTSFFIPLVAVLAEPIPTIYLTGIAVLLLTTVPTLLVMYKNLDAKHLENAVNNSFHSMNFSMENAIKTD